MTSRKVDIILMNQERRGLRRLKGGVDRACNMSRVIVHTSFTRSSYASGVFRTAGSLSVKFVDCITYFRAFKGLRSAP